MLRKVLKWVGIVLGSVLLLLGCFYGYIYFNTESRLGKAYEVAPKPITIPTDSASLARGKHLSQIRGCAGCHMPDFGGGYVIAAEDTPIGVLYGPNITSGKGGIDYTDADWIKALRHGIGKDNKPLWFMPSDEFYLLSNQDIGDIVNYAKSRPPVDKEWPKKELKPLGRVLTYFNQFPLIPAEKIDQNASYADSVQKGITPEYGKYLALTCTGCHTPTFKGGPPHGPGQPVIPDITATGNLGKWSQEQFDSAMRTGKTPEGKALSDAMPWKLFTYSDDELKAVYAYLHDLK